MNILLCMPDVFYRGGDAYIPPVGMAYVTSSLKAAGHNVYTANFMHATHQQIHDILSQMIWDHNIAAIGCGGLVVNYASIKAIIDAAKAIKPDIITFIGGGFVTFSPVEAMTIIHTADYGIIGEGEITTCELIRAIEIGSRIDSVYGIIYRSGSELVVTAVREDIPDLDHMPFPDYDAALVEMIIETRSAALVASRSCPSRCTFCCHSGGKRFRLRSMDAIFNEIDHMVQMYQINFLFLNDELFTVEISRLIEFCERIKKYDLNWKICLRISESLTYEIFKMMKDAGCVNILFGLESADDHILKSMKKGITVTLMKKVLSYAKEAGLSAQGNFIFGDPEETMESAMNTIQWVRSNHKLLDAFFLLPIICYPGSQIYKDAVNRGLINPIEHILAGCPAVNISKMSDEQYSMLVTEILPTEYGNILNMGIECAFRVHENGQYTISFTCPVCLEKSEWNVIQDNTLSAVFGCEVICDSCNHYERINLTPSYAEWIDEKLDEIITNNRCAMWPASKYFTVAFENSKALKKHKTTYILISPEDKLVNTKMHDINIYSPDVLREDDSIDTIIVFSPHYKQIVKEVQLKYPRIRPIIFHEIGFLQ